MEAGSNYIRVTIDVTANDIAMGIPKEPCACPLYHAMKRALGREVTVIGRHYRFLDSDEYVALPEEARQLACNFDNGRDVQPMTFNTMVRASDVRQDRYS